MINIINLFLSMLSFAFISYADDATKENILNSISYEEEVVTDHFLNLSGQEIAYQATAGTYNYKDEQGNTKAQFFYIAYVKKDEEEISQRPIAFCFNGGPGASSVFLHMGMLGPKRVVLDKDSKAYVPPFHYKDNPYSLLDVMDLVFIDPISTGYSRTSSGEDAKQFHDLDEDVKTVGEFIRLYVTRNDRWGSPKFLVGASYGTMRATELSAHLFEKFHMSINGMVFISAILNFQTIDYNDLTNDLPFIFYLPTYTAAAWHYKKLPANLQNDLQKAMQESRNFALGEYAQALLHGRLLSSEQRSNIATKLSAFTGLSKEYLETMNLRPKPEEYAKMLLAKERQGIGRFDCRAHGYELDPAACYIGYDPSMDTVFSAFSAAFNQYVFQDLKWVKDDDYRILAEVQPWKYGKANNRFFTATTSFREMMIRVPSFSVFVASGYFDLATPYFAMDYTLDHLDLPQAFFSRIIRKSYPAGHMIYVDQDSIGELNMDVRTFVLQVLNKKT